MAQIATKTGQQNVAMLGVGACRPQRVITNDELCKTLDSTDEWIFERSGIRSRRWISGDESNRSMSVTAAERAIVNSGIDRSTIDCVILATSTWPTITPHGAPSVASDLGINGVPAFDLVSGCGGFCYGVSVASALISAGSATNVLLIGSETMSLSLDVTSRSTAFLFGDGAGAVVIGPAEENGISPTVWGSDGENAAAIGQTINIPDFINPEIKDKPGMFLTMEGPRVFRWAAITLPKALSGALDVAGLHADDIEVFIPHQANGRINELMKKNLRLRDDVPVANDIEFTGNTSAASIPLAMEEMLATGKAEGGQTALMLGFGAGLSYAAQVVTLPPAPKITSFDDQ
ncbi:beta-ketoacyl-ACP synthase III [Gordonia sp. (in: high G+C Gram-positive bacteria)]|uniref:beta-ketoacyl-ACP synthase III n=1 Tax=Gordonia sp. (in: high G+C Gram-positive bacteria) TaxID=84139 RepID=UPI001DDCC58C|nr:beta-ketoacyl-ACP synthase III [Gordonia sp. (in: high G+C Gram-positive bacteria)]MCB1296188.1 ketoacyl-ACP synthase III [Gordonia sp. (in: high G+C Gram-positive bacteria)]HMS77519.1 beta-ketoacyl-ACP synthase III [Gordonia sp. (in: high G+C Gram-positive bacteria)]HQV17772.1 beta-ketoacyl-ACP synthase III [Gordonia sp. (in: high G+C Gram-positive bacteria)]